MPAPWPSCCSFLNHSGLSVTQVNSVPDYQYWHCSPLKVVAQEKITLIWRSLQWIVLSTQNMCHHFPSYWPAMQTPCRYVTRWHQHITHLAQAFAKLRQFNARHWPDNFFLSHKVGSAVSLFGIQMITQSGFIGVKTIPLTSFGTCKQKP